MGVEQFSGGICGSPRHRPAGRECHDGIISIGPQSTALSVFRFPTSNPRFKARSHRRLRMLTSTTQAQLCRHSAIGVPYCIGTHSQTSVEAYFSAEDTMTVGSTCVYFIAVNIRIDRFDHVQVASVPML